MAKKTLREYGILNIAAHPHPKDVYSELLSAASKIQVPFFGNDWAAITPPDEWRPGYRSGQIVIWTEIEPDTWVDKKKKREATPSQTQQVRIPADLGANPRYFWFGFRDRDHKLFFEARNENGKRLSPLRAEKFFRKLFAETPNESWKYVEVTAVPEDNTLERIFNMHRLQKLEIELTVPNADEEGAAAERLIARLKEQQIRKHYEKSTAIPGGSIVADKTTQEVAKIAATNGKVSAHGRDKNNEVVDLSTTMHPKIIRTRTGEDTGALASVRNVTSESATQDRAE